MATPIHGKRAEILLTRRCLIPDDCRKNRFEKSDQLRDDDRATAGRLPGPDEVHLNRRMRVVMTIVEQRAVYVKPEVTKPS